MADTVQTTVAVAVALNVAVTDLLKEACAAGATMLSKTKDAAKEAAKELDNKKTAPEAHAEIMARYKGNITDHNVKAIFSDSLWLLAAANIVVMVPVVSKGADKTSVPVKASEALDYSKHTMRDAAKQVRDTLDVGRAQGGGRKAESGEPKQVIVANAIVPTSTDYVALFSDATEITRAIAALELIGYKVTKAGKTVKAVAAATTATPTLAAQLGNKILEAAA